MTVYTHLFLTAQIQTQQLSAVKDGVVQLSPPPHRHAQALLLTEAEVSWLLLATNIN